VRQAIKRLRVLDDSFRVLAVGGREYVASVPCQVSMDAHAVLAHAQVQVVRKGFGWRRLVRRLISLHVSAVRLAATHRRRATSRSWRWRRRLGGPVHALRSRWMYVPASQLHAHAAARSALSCVQAMTHDGIAMVDDGADGDRLFWFPCLADTASAA